MSLRDLIPLTTLAQAPQSQVFELAAPDPIMGTTTFLRLPILTGWTYDVNPTELQVKRNLILRSQMWVTRGRARFTATHVAGGTVRFTVRVRPKTESSVFSGADKQNQTALQRVSDERTTTRSEFFGLRKWWSSGKHLSILCHETERRIQIEARADQVFSGDLDDLLSRCQCH